MDKRIWLITGISSGLGQALAKAVMDTGDFVIGTFRQQSQANQFIADNKGRGFAFVMDQRREENIDTLAGNVIQHFGKVDILVNNAGQGFAGAIEETSIKEARNVFDSNVFGMLKVIQVFLPAMRKQKSGHIIQISSHGGVKAFAGFGIYNASKFALEGVSEALAQEVEPLGIKVTIVEPGPFRTKFAGASFGLAATEIDDYKETAGLFRNRIKGVDGKQEGDPAKAAKAIVDVVNRENPPLRLPLGKIAIATITAKIESLQMDLDNNRSVAENAVF